MQMIQLKWSDEETWKDYEPAENDTKAQIARLQQSWESTKKQYELKYDAEFRVHA